MLIKSSYSSLACMLAILSSTSASPSPQSVSAVTFWQFANPSDTEATVLPTNPAWAEPIGTASNGEETTYVYNAVLPVEPLTGTTTEFMTYSETLAVGASGIKIPSYLGVEEAVCTLTSPNSGDCVYEGVKDWTDSGVMTVTESGLTVVPVVVAVSTPAPTVTGSGSESLGTSSISTGSGGGLSVGATGGSSSSSSAAGAAASTQSNGAPLLGGGVTARVGLLGVAQAVIVGVVSGIVF